LSFLLCLSLEAEVCYLGLCCGVALAANDRMVSGATASPRPHAIDFTPSSLCRHIPKRQPGRYLSSRGSTFVHLWVIEVMTVS